MFQNSNILDFINLNDQIEKLSNDGQWEKIFSLLGNSPNTTIELLSYSGQSYSEKEIEEWNFRIEIIKLGLTIISLMDWVLFLFIFWYIFSMQYRFIRWRLISLICIWRERVWQIFRKDSSTSDDGAISYGSNQDSNKKLLKNQNAKIRTTNWLHFLQTVCNNKGRSL